METVLDDGTKVWTNSEGGYHRPAVLWFDGTEEWYKEGEFHQENGPARIRSDGTQEWYKDGKLHRDDLMWFKAGKGAYLHVSGLYGIQKNQKNNRWYIVDAETGEVMEHPKYAPMSFSGFSLTDAKYEFEKNMAVNV